MSTRSRLRKQKSDGEPSPDSRRQVLGEPDNENSATDLERSPCKDCDGNGPSRGVIHRKGGPDAASTALGTNDGSTSSRVTYDSGPDVWGLSERYGIDFVKDGQAKKVNRLESDFGQQQVQRWALEGMTVETMGKPRDMGAFRQRQESRPDAVPGDIERRNQASVQRNTGCDSKAAGDTSVPEVVRSVVSSPGTSMDERVQREMESKMGTDFTDVQLHTGPQAVAAAESINARAFTVGNHVAFNRGEYQPDSDSGKKLLAHELTHVRQENNETVSLLPTAESDSDDGRPYWTEDMHVQPRLEVSSPNDPAEKEAERVASKVMQMDRRAGHQHERAGDGTHAHADAGDSTSTAAPSVDPTAEMCPRCVKRYQEEKPLNCTECEEKVQTKCSDCEEEREGAVFREATAVDGGNVSSGAEQKISAVQAQDGEQLPEETRSKFEPRFGTDFSDVEVHTGSTADEAAQLINAEAFTVGSDIGFRSGAYEPDRESGQELIAHELTHVVQQTGDANRVSLNESKTPPIRRESGRKPVRRVPVVTGITPFSEEIARFIGELIVDMISDQYSPDEEPEGRFLPLHAGYLAAPEEDEKIDENYRDMGMDYLEAGIIPQNEEELEELIQEHAPDIDGWLEENAPEFVTEGKNLLSGGAEALGIDDTLESGWESLLSDTTALLRDLEEYLEERIEEPILDDPPEFSNLDHGNPIDLLKIMAVNDAVRVFSDYEGPPVMPHMVFSQPYHELVNELVDETYGENWVTELAPCPVEIPGPIDNPGSGPEVDGFEDETGPQTPSTHPGAVLDYRADGFQSVPGINHGQQCCYSVPECDELDRTPERYILVTLDNTEAFSSAVNELTPGTPDVWSPKTATLEHNIVDVIPFFENKEWYATDSTWSEHAGVNMVSDPCELLATELEGEEQEKIDDEETGERSSGAGGGVDDETERKERHEPGGQWLIKSR